MEESPLRRSAGTRADSSRTTQQAERGPAACGDPIEIWPPSGCNSLIKENSPEGAGRELWRHEAAELRRQGC